MKILWFMKNQYLRGNCLKRGPAQFGDLRGGGGGLAKKRGWCFWRGVDALNAHYVTACNYPYNFWKKSTWKTRHVSENKIKRIPCTFWKFGRLFSNLEHPEETLIIGRLLKGSRHLDHVRFLIVSAIISHCSHSFCTQCTKDIVTACTKDTKSRGA